MVRFFIFLYIVIVLPVTLPGYASLGGVVAHLYIKNLFYVQSAIFH